MQEAPQKYTVAERFSFNVNANDHIVQPIGDREIKILAENIEGVKRRLEAAAHILKVRLEFVTPTHILLAGDP